MSQETLVPETETLVADVYPACESTPLQEKELEEFKISLPGTTSAYVIPIEKNNSCFLNRLVH